MSMRTAIVAAACAVVLTSTAGEALEDGITGYSGLQHQNCNDHCHQEGGVTPLVAFDGPTQVSTGVLATFRFVVTSQDSRQTVAGFNVAADGGVLAPLADEGERLEADELTHVAPKANGDLGEAAWRFLWQAPDEPGTYTLYGAGLSANGNGNRNGDDSRRTTLTVEVVNAGGDANCDGRVGAADVAAVMARIGRMPLPECPDSDVGMDGVVGTDDLAATLAFVFSL